MQKEITKLDARQRNLKMIMVREYTSKKFKIKDKFTEDTIVKLFFFRQSDLQNSLKFFFTKKGEAYIFKNNIADEISEMSSKHFKAITDSKETSQKYVNLFKLFSEDYLNNIHKGDSSEKYNTFYNEFASSLEELHWFSLPEFSEQMMINRGMIPEDNILEYYNHYHSLEDLYDVLTGKTVPSNSYKGDINLNKRLSFRVYSRRWGHDDTYSVERRTEGWFVSHLAINGPSKKDGTGSMIANLDHDSIQYPKEGVRYAFRTLWYLADEDEMSTEELQVKLQEIADWISAVEKTIGEFQPDWCGYY